MNNNIKYILGVIVLIIISFFIGRCTYKCESIPRPVTIVTPEIKDSFYSPKVLVPESNTIKTVIKYKDTIISIPQVNQELVEKYIALQNETDVVKKENASLKMYADAVSIKDYNIPFEDDNIKLTIKAKTQGLLLEAKPDYTIKSKSYTTSVDIPKPKEKVFSMNVGASASYKQDLNKLDPAVNLQFVTKSGHIIGTSYSVDKVIGVSYTIPLFSIKK